MHSLYFGGGVAQDSKSREAVSPTHYFRMTNKAIRRPVAHAAGLFFKYTR